MSQSHTLPGWLLEIQREIAIWGKIQTVYVKGKGTIQQTYFDRYIRK